MPLPSTLRRRKRSRPSAGESTTPAAVPVVAANTEVYSEDLKQLRVIVVILVALFTLCAYTSNNVLRQAQDIDNQWRFYFKSWISSHSFHAPLYLKLRTTSITDGDRTADTVLLIPTNETQAVPVIQVLSSALHELHRLGGHRSRFEVSLSAPGIDLPLKVFVREEWPRHGGQAGPQAKDPKPVAAAIKSATGTNQDAPSSKDQLTSKCSIAPLPAKMLPLELAAGTGRTHAHAFGPPVTLAHAQTPLNLDLRSNSYRRYPGAGTLPLPTIVTSWTFDPDRAVAAQSLACSDFWHPVIELVDLGRHYTEGTWPYRKTDAELLAMHNDLAKSTRSLLEGGVQVMEGIRIPLAHASAALAISLLALSTAMSMILRRTISDYGVCPRHILLGLRTSRFQRITPVDSPIQATMEYSFRTMLLLVAILSAPIAIGTLPFVYGELGVAGQLHEMWGTSWYQTLDLTSPLVYLFALAMLQSIHQCFVLFGPDLRRTRIM